MYTKDITFLLRLLGSSKQSGVLLVEAPGPDESPWQGQFQLENGLVRSCVLLDKANGRVVLRDEEALQWLTARGKLEWHMEEEDVPPPTPPPRLLPPGNEPGRADGYAAETPPPAPGSKQLRMVPQRALIGNVVSAEVFASREHRQVFALIDGQRTVEEIAQLLHRPAEFIISILQDLQARGLIV